MKKLVMRRTCEACGGTGIYSGCMEAEGNAVQCSACEGTGCEVITGIFFKARRIRHGIKNIIRRIFNTKLQKRFIETMPYKDWLKGKRNFKRL